MAMPEETKSARAITLSVIVPLRDEMENVRSLIDQLDQFRAGFPYDMELILVDDGSRDRSWEVIRERAATRPWLRAIRFRAGRGQTAAMVAGIQASRGEYITFLDADLQNDPNDIPRLLAPVLAGDADVVCGWRRRRQDNLVLRTFPSVLANWLIRKVLRVPIHDLGCTLKVFRREYVESINMLGEMHRFLAAYAQAEGAKLMEMEVTHRPRLHGDSSVVAYRAFVLQRVESTPMIFMMMLMYIAALVALMSGLLAEINMRVLYQVGVYKPFEVRERIGFEGTTAETIDQCAASSAD
jgi:glycosyltransferase involved in cell wall biosynthesis